MVKTFTHQSSLSIELRYKIMKYKSGFPSWCLPMQAILAINLSIVVGIIMSKWSLRREPSPPEEPYVCLQKELFGPGDNDNATSYKLILKVNDTQYCGKASDVLKAAAEVALTRLYNSDGHPESPADVNLLPKYCEQTEQPSVIHLTHPYVETNDSTNITLFWNKTTIKHKEDLHYSTDNGTLLIRKPGFYFVGLHLLVQCNISTRVLDTCVYRKPAAGDNDKADCILHDTKTGVNPLDNTTYITSESEAVFELQSGDQLYVAVSRLHCFQQTDKWLQNSVFYVYKV